MIDFGLLVTLVLLVAVPTMVERWWPLDTGDAARFGDFATGPALAGLIAGRVAAVAIDNPAALTSLRDLMILRSGVEFWPGVAVAVVVGAVSARKSGVPVMRRLAAVVPLALIGAATFEATCLVRDGCFGPASPIGLRPDGLATRVAPIGLVVAVATAAAAVAIRRWLSGAAATVIVFAGLTAVAVPRAIGSIWLPHVGDGPTRQHLSSVAVAVAAVAALAFSSSRQRQSSMSAP